MDMEMIHGLASVRFTVNHKPGAFFSTPLFLSQGLGFMEHPSYKEGVGNFQLHDIRNMLFGNYQEMNRPLRRYILKSQDLLILIQFLSRYYARSDVTKNTVTHIRRSIPY
jgi:hypothetical protein